MSLIWVSGIHCLQKLSWLIAPEKLCIFSNPYLSQTGISLSGLYLSTSWPRTKNPSACRTHVITFVLENNTGWKSLNGSSSAWLCPVLNLLSVHVDCISHCSPSLKTEFTEVSSLDWLIIELLLAMKHPQMWFQFFWRRYCRTLQERRVNQRSWEKLKWSKSYLWLPGVLVDRELKSRFAHHFWSEGRVRKCWRKRGLTEWAAERCLSFEG